MPVWFGVDFNLEYYEQAKWMTLVHRQSDDITQLNMSYLVVTCKINTRTV